jgi:hypothetical protein
MSIGIRRRTIMGVGESQAKQIKAQERKGYYMTGLWLPRYVKLRRVSVYTVIDTSLWIHLGLCGEDSV